MSWLYSRALVAEYSGEGSLAGGQSAPLSATPTPQAYCLPDKTTECSRLSRYGMTFAPLTDDLGEAVLTSFLAAFPAKTLAWPERAQDLTEPVAGSGRKWPVSLARFDPDSCLWKTAQRSLLEDSDECLVTWPRSGMTVDGQCWELPTLARRTSGIGSGVWLPTPTVGMVTGGQNPEKGGQIGLGYMARKNAWPTPTGTLGTHGGMVMTYQTPVSRMHKDNGRNPSELDRNSPTLAMQAGGSLNPPWVEWLMGWPLGWTDLKPLETDKCPSALRLRGAC
jgi:hypothetical protein